MSTQTKHTPGPWYIPTIRANFADKRPLWETVRSKHTEEPICRIAQDMIHDAEANAHLIAAAPELLGCAKNAVYWALRQHAMDTEEGKVDLGVKPGWILSLQAAIAKAEGRD